MFGFEPFLHSVPRINLTGHALERLANHAGFKKSDTFAAKQKLVHAIGMGSNINSLSL
jgi:hypothetical protein